MFVVYYLYSVFGSSVILYGFPGNDFLFCVFWLLFNFHVLTVTLGISGFFGFCY